MANVDLAARPRTVLGKKVSRLRRAGVIPCNIYGQNTPSTAIEVPMPELRRVLRAAGRTNVIRIALDGETAPRNVVVRGVQRKFTTGEFLHIDFQQVSMSEMMTVRVPIHLAGVAPVTDVGCVVVQQLDSVEVECLPDNMPDHIEADLSKLVTTTSAIHVSDLSVPANVTLLTPLEQMVASVS